MTWMQRLGLEGLTIRAAVVLGFGLTLGVWLFTGYYFTRRLSAVEAESAAISARYMRAQELLSNVAGQVLLSSVYLRDALLDPNPSEIHNHRQRLEDTYDALDRELDQYVPVLDSLAERQQVDRLRQEIEEYRETTRAVLGRDITRTPAETRILLNTHVVPRRENVIRVTEDVRAINRTAFVQQQNVIAGIHRLAERRSWQWLGAALAISLGIGLLAIVYSARLENSLRRQQAVEAQHTQHLQHLSAKLITAQEEERQNIARELHDEVGQVLTAIKVELAVAQRRIEHAGGSPHLLDDVQSIADAALHTVRDLSHLLHPALLDDLGLAAAIDWYLHAFGKRHSISVSFRQDGMARRLAPEIELAAYRVVQEALTNVARHAEATTCRVVLRQVADVLDITVEDDGKGFERSALEETGARRGLGLLGMRERAAQFSGTVHIETAPGAGTRVKVSLPARPQAATAAADESDQRDGILGPETARG